MTTSRMTFGEHLKQFALSIDFLEPEHYDLVQRQLLKYLKIQLDAVQVAFFERIRIDECEGIATVWSAPSFRIQQTLRERKKYRRQLAMALGRTRNLWVISRSSEALSAKNKGVDIWGESENDDLPPFDPAPGAPPARTSVSIITRGSQGEPNGVFLVTLRNQVRPTKILRRELQTLADAVGLLHATDWATREQRRGTASAIARLADLVPDAELDTGPRPFLFVASPSRADPEVVEAIEAVLAKFRDRVFARHWSEMHRPGNINMQLVEQIRGAQFGICYLSEPTGGKESPRFRDNPNVLIEAGMLHMVTRTSGSTDTGWIPIRERDSEAAPFDLENQRMVLVERNGDRLDQEAFKRDLENKLDSLLQGDDSLWGPDQEGRDEAQAPGEEGPARSHLAAVPDETGEEAREAEPSASS